MSLRDRPDLAWPPRNTGLPAASARRVVFVTDHSFFAGIRVLALAGVLCGCGARSAIEQTEKVEVTGSCAASCEEMHPGGLSILHENTGGCACRTCSDACAQSVCLDDETPSNACLPCFQEGLITRCVPHDGHFACLGDEDCSALFACITACPNK